MGEVKAVWPKQCDPCPPDTLAWTEGSTECIECPVEGVNCAIQDRITLWKGYYRPKAVELTKGRLGGQTTFVACTDNGIELRTSRAESTGRACDH